MPYISSQALLPIILIAVLATVYYFNPTFLNDFLTLTPAEGESTWGAFSHKIPMILFLIVAGTLLFLSLTKKLSLIPVLGLLSCLYLMTELGVSNWTRFAVWLLFGFAIYFGYSYSRSNLTGNGLEDKKTNSFLAIASIGFLVSGFGLGITAFSFVADLILHLFPALTRETVYTFEVGMFLVGLIVGVAGVYLGKRPRP